MARGQAATRLAAGLAVALAAGAGGAPRLLAETNVVDPSTLEFGISNYRVSIASAQPGTTAPSAQTGTTGAAASSSGGSQTPSTVAVNRAAISQTLSYAFNPSFAIATGASLGGANLFVGSGALRWFPRQDARPLSEREGATEVERTSAFKPYVAAKLEYGMARSPYVPTGQPQLALNATFEGMGVGGGAHFELGSHFGVGFDAAVSYWTDTLQSDLKLSSVTIETTVEGHLNF